MPMKAPPQKKIIDLNAPQEELTDDEEERAFREEEAKLRAEELKRELEEQNKFDCLCDGIKNAMSLVDSSFTELLELKDELLTHSLPPSVLVALTLATGKMFRSITDLHTPVQELTRLVNVYSVPWEQKSEQLKKLHTDYESKKRQLNIAIRKLQLIDSQARRMERERIISNWEKVFAKMTSQNTIGRRWKFMIEAFKKKCKDGTIYNELSPELETDTDSSEDEEEPMVEEDVAKNKRRFMMSVITASPPHEDADDASQQGESDIATEAEGIPSEISDSFGNPEEMSPDIVPKRRRGVSFGPPGGDDEEGEVQATVYKEVIRRPPMKSKSTWTHEPDFKTRLAMRIYKPIGLPDELKDYLTCGVKVGKVIHTTGFLPTGGGKEEMEKSTKPEKENDDSKENTKQAIPTPDEAPRRKSIGFAKKPLSPKAPSTTKISKPSSSILKRVRSPTDVEDGVVAQDDAKIPEENILDRESFEEIRFELNDNIEEDINVSLSQSRDGESKVVAMSVLSTLQIKDGNLLEKLESKSEFNAVHGNEGEKQEVENTEGKLNIEGEIKGTNIDDDKDNRTSDFETLINEAEPFMLPLTTIKIGIGGHKSAEVARLPVVCYFVKEEIPVVTDNTTDAIPINDLIMEETGVDMNVITKEELMSMLGKEYHDACLSAMSFESSSSRKSGFLPVEDFESLKDEHDREMRRIHEEYEIKMQELLTDIEQMQQQQDAAKTQVNENWQAQIKSAGGDAPLVTGFVQRQEQVREELNDYPQKIRQNKPSRGRFPGLPDWGANLPKNVWVRMRLLTEEMMEKRREVDMRIRQQIATNIEKKLAPQYKLQRTTNALHGPLQDVSLPALFMPSRTGNVYNPRARLYFHPAGTAGELRLSQPPSIFQLPPLPEKAKASVVNLFELSKNFENPSSYDWLSRVASAQMSKESRATTAASKRSRFASPTTPAPTANNSAYDIINMKQEAV